MRMISDVYESPELEVSVMETASMLCGSGNGNSDSYGSGKDFGGKDRWEGTRW